MQRRKGSPAQTLAWAVGLLIAAVLVSAGTTQLLRLASHPSGSLTVSGLDSHPGSPRGGAQAALPPPSPPTFLPIPTFPPAPTFAPFPTYSEPSFPSFPPHSFPPFASPSFATFMPMRKCTASDLAFSIATDSHSYASGATVTITLTVANRSATACETYDDRCTHIGALARSAALGQDVWDSRHDRADATDCPSAFWAATYVVDLWPGAAPHHVSLTWAQQQCTSTCSDAHVPAGQYAIRGFWKNFDGTEADAGPVSIQIGG